MAGPARVDTETARHVEDRKDCVCSSQGNSTMYLVNAEMCSRLETAPVLSLTRAANNIEPQKVSLTCYKDPRCKKRQLSIRAP